jgi:fatty acid desaturase
MHAHPRPDPRLASIPWRDLVPLSRAERLWELSLSLPWLAASLAAYHFHEPLLGAPLTFFFFLTGLRQSHNAQHYCLGLSRRAHDLVLFTLSLLMLTSMHAVQVTHLHHHRHCLDEHDIEASHARHPWWRVLLTGPLFPIKIHTSAWRLGAPAKRRWIAAELIGAAALIALALAIPAAHALRWHLAAVAAGECMTGFFAVWIVHRGCDHDRQIARTQRGLLKNLLSYSMFYHLEHHLFPAIPTCHLPRLAQRLDTAAPEYRKMQVV